MGKLPSSGPALVVLAAGMGSRYGGLKQLDAVGPGGATLMDYAVFDAARAGFAGVVFVIRPDMEAAFASFAAHRYGGRIAVTTVHQRLDAVPPGFSAHGRTRPWGTAHAVLCAATEVDRSFVVVNADDFYGAAAYQAAARFLEGEAGGTPPAWAVVGYRVSDTVSPAGGVNRAICRARGGWLSEIEELRDIAPEGAAFAGRGASGRMPLQGDDLVSMNMWAFTTEIFDMLRREFSAFLKAGPGPDDEFLLPGVVQGAVANGAARVRVLDPRSPWLGMTYSADRPAVVRALEDLTRAGQYPASLA